MSIWKAGLKVKPGYKTGSPVRVIFELTNEDEVDRYVLSWNTPLDGLRSDCLRLWHDGVPVTYDGIQSKRLEPQTSDYRLVRASETISVRFDLSRAYAVSGPGQYHLGLNLGLLESFVAASPDPEWLDAQLADREALSKQLQRGTPALQGGVDFNVEAGLKTVETIGQKARRTSHQQWARVKAQLVGPLLVDNLHPNPFKPAWPNPSPLEFWNPLSRFRGIQPFNNQSFNYADHSASAQDFSNGVRLPNFLGGNADQRQQLTANHIQAFQLAVGALNELWSLYNSQGLATNARYRKWFGAYDQNNASQVYDILWAIGQMANRLFIYDLTAPQCQVHDFAYQLPVASPTDPAQTGICSQFWLAPPMGANSRAGTLVHEMCHVAGLDDQGYGLAYALNTAQNAPPTAVRNPDNYEYYVENV